MSFSAKKSASAARASIREEKRKKEQEEALKEEDVKMKKDKFYNERMMMAALRQFTPKQMKEHGITLIYPPEDPNATPRSPNYMRPTTASARHRVAKGGRRTRKRRNDKKKTMRRGRMRKSGMRRRRYSSRNKRGGDIETYIPDDIFDNEEFKDESGEKVFKFNINDEYYIRVVIDENGEKIKYLRNSETPINDKGDKIVAMKLFIPDDVSKHCILGLTVQFNRPGHMDKFRQDRFYEITKQELKIARVFANDLKEKMDIFEA